jgi:hypothetical protein
MSATLSIPSLTRRLIALGAVVLALAASARAQDGIQAGDTSATAWQHYDWLAAGATAQKPVETVKTTVSQATGDPFTVLSTGELWQEKYAAVDTRRLDDTLFLSCETSTVDLDGYSDDLSRGQKVGLQFEPTQEFILRTDLHDSTSDAPMPGQSTTTSGAAFSAEGHLPMNSVLTVGVETDYATPDDPSGLASQTNAYDAQWKQPLGALPLTAQLKGHYEGTSVGGAAPTSLPSLEQSLEWKPLQNTTIQAGLRQQQYQEYPGVDHQLNEALFADWQQKVVDDVTWHSYAEVLNSKGLLDQAPAAPIASGSNGTPQATTPGSNSSLTSSLPVSIDDQTLTFSTGPSFRLQQDISASVEYSDRWDKNPAAGSTGQEQRVSVSVKGTF